jgi:hypothetical protein
MEMTTLLCVLIFVVAGLFILKSLEKLPQANSKHEEKYLKENQERASRQIKVCLVTLIVYIAYNFCYSLGLKLWAPYCTDVFVDHNGMNNLLWFVSRGMSDFFWMYPFLYLFWPKAVKMEARAISCVSEPGQTEYDYITVYTDSDDEIEVVYPENFRSSGMKSFSRSIKSNAYTVSIHSKTKNR